MNRPTGTIFKRLKKIIIIMGLFKKTTRRLSIAQIDMQLKLIQNARERYTEKFSRIHSNHVDEQGFNFGHFCRNHNESDEAKNLNHRYGMLLFEMESRTQRN